MLLPSYQRNSLEIWSEERLPFEPKGWLRQLRDEIRRGVYMLKDEPGRALSALYTSPVVQVCDVENVLFYNVGPGIFAALASAGLRFERVFSKPPPSPINIRKPMQHYQRYSFAPKATGFSYWKVDHLLARWQGVGYRRTAGRLDVASVWRSMKLGAGSGQVMVESMSEVPLARLALNVVVHIPRGIHFNLAVAIKPIFDGIVAAFHKHDGSDEDIIVGRLAGQLSVKEGEVISLLRNGLEPLLGTRRLVWPWGKSVQWNPADDLLVAAQMLIEQNSSTDDWEFSGQLFTVADDLRQPCTSNSNM